MFISKNVIIIIYSIAIIVVAAFILLLLSLLLFHYSVLLGDSIPSKEAVSQVLPTLVKPTPHAMWVGTNDGHLFGFCHVTFNLLIAVKQHSSIESIVSTGSDCILVFGQWACDGSPDHGNSRSSIGGFSVWRLHTGNIVLKE